MNIKETTSIISSYWDELKHANAPPWEWQEAFPEGQLILFSDTKTGKPIAGATTVKAQWNGFVDTIPTHAPHNPKGNTLVVNEMITHLDQGTENILDWAQALMHSENLNYLLACMPIKTAWYTDGADEAAFAKYMDKHHYHGEHALGGDEGTIYPYILKGFHLITPSYYAKHIIVPFHVFESYVHTYTPGSWKQLTETTWHCKGTSGIWKVNKTQHKESDFASYIAPSAWIGKSSMV